MALDFALIGEDGSPEQSVALSVPVHQELMQIATGQPLALLRRLQDYYHDRDFHSCELPQLVEEVWQVRQTPQIGRQLEAFLLELEKLLESALAREASLAVIAD